MDSVADRRQLFACLSCPEVGQIRHNEGPSLLTWGFEKLFDRTPSIGLVTPG